MAKFINLSGHASTRLLSHSPYIMGTKNGREIKYADLTGFSSVEEYLREWGLAIYPANPGALPEVKDVGATTIVEKRNNTPVTRSISGKTIITDLPEPQEGVTYITSVVVAKAAKRSDVVSPDAIADPETGLTIGAIGYFAFG